MKEHFLPAKTTVEELVARAEKLNQKIARQLHIEPLALAISKRLDFDVAYSPVYDTLQLTVGGLLLSEKKLEAAMAHEYGHYHARMMGIKQTPMASELDADRFVAKTCRPELVIALKQYLVEQAEAAGRKLDESGTHPSVNTRSLNLDKAFQESCGRPAPAYTPPKPKKDANSPPPPP